MILSYWGENNIALISLNTFEIKLLEINRYDRTDGRLVEAAGVLLAVYNGVRRSGTGATVNYARKLGREIIVIDPATLHITHESPALGAKL